ncbi:MAG: YitT family protein [Lachnospiraceae bacterium]|nr:YitT family protein [Lachnospiraceae bacterium]
MDICMKDNARLARTAVMLVMVVLGNMLYALAVKLFLLPSGLITGGTTGIALVMNHVAGIPVSLFVLVFNVTMLVAGYLLLGKTFAVTTVVSTFIYPLSLELFDRLLGEVAVTQDILLCMFFSGLGIGTALGMVIRAGASTGGMDIPPLVLNKYFGIPVSVSLYVFDFCILIAQMFYNPAEKILYGILLVLVYTIVLDKLMLMGTTRTEVKVVSQKAQEIRGAILKQMDRGVTMLDARTGYLDQELQMIFSVISNRELPAVERLIHEIDPESFMVVSRVSEVSGRGFSMKKEYK